MSFAVLVFQVIVAWILMASAAYYGALVALRSFFDADSWPELDGERTS